MVVLLFGDWKKMALRGVAAMLFGVLTLLWPSITLTALVLLFGAYVLLVGVSALAAALADRPELRGQRKWVALEGIVSVAAGGATFFWPHITALVLLYLIAFWAAVTGALELAMAVQLRGRMRHDWLLGLVGVLSIVVAVLLAAFPGEGALAITWLIGWYAMVTGALLVGLAIQLHKLESMSGERRPARQATA
jgi:uncharacterized membrane protein HdeD (DUF308 family)